MISNGAKTIRYKINLTKMIESGSDRSVADSCGAGRRVASGSHSEQLCLWSMADSCRADSGATACDQYEHYSRRNLRQAGRALCNGPQREKFIAILSTKPGTAVEWIPQCNPECVEMAGR